MEFSESIFLCFLWKRTNDIPERGRGGFEVTLEVLSSNISKSASDADWTIFSKGQENVNN